MVKKWEKYEINGEKKLRKMVVWRRPPVWEGGYFPRGEVPLWFLGRAPTSPGPELCASHYILCTMHYVLCIQHYALCTLHYALCNIPWQAPAQNSLSHNATHWYEVLHNLPPNLVVMLHKYIESSNALTESCSGSWPGQGKIPHCIVCLLFCICFSLFLHFLFLYLFLYCMYLPGAL